LFGFEELIFIFNICMPVFGIPEFVFHYLSFSACLSFNLLIFYLLSLVFWFSISDPFSLLPILLNSLLIPLVGLQVCWIYVCWLLMWVLSWWWRFDLLPYYRRIHIFHIMTKRKFHTFNMSNLIFKTFFELFLLVPYLVHQHQLQSVLYLHPGLLS